MSDQFFTEKMMPSRYEVFFVDLMLDQNNTDPNFGRTDFHTDPNSYDTPKTTDDSQAFNPDQPKKRYRLSTGDLGPGAGVHFPILDRNSVAGSSVQLKIGEASISAKFNMRVADIITNDAFELQGEYADRRVRGSFLGKLEARNFLQNREVFFYRGYLAPGERFDINNFERERYIIKEFKRNRDGSAQIQVVDPVFRATRPKGKAPFESNGTLTNDITAAATSLTVSSSDQIIRDINGTPTPINEFSLQGTGFPAKSIYLKIDREIILLSSDPADETSATNQVIFNNVQRGMFNTVAVEHDRDAKVEKCLAFNDETIGNALSTLLKDFFDIESIQDNSTDGFFDEMQFSGLDFGSIRLDGIITKPERALNVMNEILAVSRSSIYWDPVLSRIVLHSSFEDTDPVYTFDYRTNIQEGSLVINEKTINQITRQTINFGKIDYTSGNEEDNFARSFTFIDGTVESEENVGVVNFGRDITTSFIGPTAAEVQFAVSSASQAVLRDGPTPKEFTFVTDIESIGHTSRVNGVLGNRVWIGSVVNMFTDRNLGPDGLPIGVKCLVTQIKRLATSLWEVRCVTFGEQEDTAQTVDFVVTQDMVSSENNRVRLDELFPGPKPDGRPAVVLIESGVDIIGAENDPDSLSPGNKNPALSTGTDTDWPNGLRLINRGRILGAGGEGGDGGDISALPTTIGRGSNSVLNVVNGNLAALSGKNGGNGGNAIFNLVSNLVIDNSNGIIWAGGGGAGGNSAFVEYRTFILGSARLGSVRGSGGSAGAGGSYGQNVNPGHPGPDGVIPGEATGPARRLITSATDQYNSVDSGVDGDLGTTDGQGQIRPVTSNSPRDGGDYGSDGLRGVSFNALFDSGVVRAIPAGNPGLAGMAVQSLGDRASATIISGNNSTQVRGRVE